MDQVEVLPQQQQAAEDKAAEAENHAGLPPLEPDAFVAVDGFQQGIGKGCLQIIF